jgi:hypothetical protein
LPKIVMPIHIHPIATKDVEVTMQRNSNAEYEYYNNTQKYQRYTQMCSST